MSVPFLAGIRITFGCAPLTPTAVAETVSEVEPAELPGARRLRGAAQTPTERTETARERRARRDQIPAVLDQKVKLVRAAARFAFRGVPRLAREAGSAYGRRTRAAVRRRRAQEDSQAVATDTVGSV